VRSSSNAALARGPADILYNAVAAAVMAPSTHNSQPWRFRIHGATLDLFADPERHLAIIDRDRRQQVQSCGCALFNARVAVRAMGFADEVTTMLVDADRPNHLASLHLGGLHVASDVDHALMAAIPLRRTNRRPFLPRPVPDAALAVLGSAAEREGARLVRLPIEDKPTLARLIEDADRAQFADPAFRDELARWLIPFGSWRRDGIPFEEKEYGSNLPLAVMRALRSPSLGHTVGKLEEELVDGAPLIVVIGTRGDTPADWLAAGQALEAALLHATMMGLSAAFLNQVLEVPVARAALAELVSPVGRPQMVLRLGVPAGPVRHVAPRRAVDSFLE
jgi:nitroreductase